MSAPLQVVVIGGGYFSRFHHDAWIRMPGVTLKAIVEPDDSNRKKLSLDYPEVNCVASTEEALGQGGIAIVDVVTPPATHTSLVEQVMSLTGNDTIVICQKPFCTSLDEATRLTEKIRPRKLVIHENFRFQPWYAEIKSMLEQGKLGDVQQARLCMRPGDGRGERAYLDRQPYFQQMARFLIRETGIHWIDTFRYLFGEPDSLYADLRRINPHIAGEDAGFFLFQYASGLRVLFDGNRHLDHSADNKRFTMGELLVEGTKASVRLDGNGRLYIRHFGEIDEQPVDYQFDDLGFAGDSVYRLNQHVVEHMTMGTPLHNQAADYLRNLELEKLVYESADSGARVSC